VDFNKLPSTRTFFSPDKQSFMINQEGAAVETCEEPLFEVRLFKASSLLHPSPGAFYYRFTDCEDGASCVCLWDIETPAEGEAAKAEYESLVSFIRSTDFLVHDMMYSDDEYKSIASPVKGYGHSSYGMAIATAAKAAVQNLVAFHYNPLHTDAMLDELGANFAGQIIMAKQGESFTVRKGAAITPADRRPCERPEPVH
jgi:hypothetical protein